MSGEEGRQVCSICTLIIQPAVPPCSLPASYQGFTSAAGDPVFGVGQVAAAKLRGWEALQWCPHHSLCSTAHCSHYKALPSLLMEQNPLGYMCLGVGSPLHASLSG